MQRLKQSVPFVIAAVGAAAVLWPVPYGDVSLLDRGFLGVWIVPAVVAGVAGQLLAGHALARAGIVGGAAYAAVVLIRIVVEVVSNVTTHNLWPVEVAVAVVVGCLGSVVGAVISRRWARPTPAS